MVHSVYMPVLQLKQKNSRHRMQAGYKFTLPLAFAIDTFL